MRILSPNPCNTLRPLPLMKRLLLTLAGVLLVSQTRSLQAAILLNEIHIRTPLSSDTVAADGNHEFVEVRSTTGGEEFCTADGPNGLAGTATGLPLWVLIIENDGGGVGEIRQAWPLVNRADGTPMKTGSNGLLLLGDDYTRPGSPYEFVKSPQTTMGDPEGMSTDDLPDDNALTVLLVANYTRPANVPVGVDPDVDVLDAGDGVFDWARAFPPAGSIAKPWTGDPLDSVGYNGDQGSVIKRAYVPAAANLSRTSTANSGVPQYGTTGNFMPHTLARSSVENAPNSRTAWYGGTVSGSSAASVTYGASYMNLIGASWTGAVRKGQVTPGQSNLSSDFVQPVFRINELNLHPPGDAGRSPDPANKAAYLANDGNFEYIEIINTAANQAGGTNFSGSLAGYALLMVDSGGGSIGRIRKAWNLNKLATGTNGLLVLGDDYADGYSPFARTQDSTTQLADPDEILTTAVPPVEQWSKLSRGDLSNNGVTFLLVTGYNGMTGVSATDDLDDNNDGVLDTFPAPPYSSLVDSVSVPEVVTDQSSPNFGDLVAGQGGYSAAKPDIVVNGDHYNADNLSRIRGVNTANATAAWSAGEFGSRSPYAFGYKNGFNITGTGTAFRGAASPGRQNYNAASPPATGGSVLLNEVNINFTGTDNIEYIELASSFPHELLTNYWIIVLEATPAASGRVVKVFDLRAQSTGANRLAIFGDGIEEAASPVFRSCSAQTLREDPESFNANGTPNAGDGFRFGVGDNIPNNGVSILLVSYIATTATGVPATPDADLDSNNDGTLDAAPPWTLIDGISTGNGVGGVPAVPVSGFSPGNICRVVEENPTANSADKWFGGELTGGTTTGFAYTSNHFGTFKGAGSPGRHNVTATPNPAVAVLLNEININPPGGDNEKEFVEIRSANNAALSTNGYSILLIDNDGNDPTDNTGRVLECWDLDSTTTGANGLLLAGSGYTPGLPPPGLTPWTNPGDTPHPDTALFSPVTMDFDDIGRNSDNGAITILLVKNFIGRAGDDLDEGTPTDLTANDDRIFNMPPQLPLQWDSQADSVAMLGFVAATPGPPATVDHFEGWIYPGTPNLSATIPLSGGYTPDTVGRFAGNNAANNPAAWYGANILGTEAKSTVYSTTQFFPSTLIGGKVTPGYTNVAPLTDDSDPDGDGVPYLMEIALGMNPTVSIPAETQRLPRLERIVVNNVLQPVFTVIRPSGGVSGIKEPYTVEASFDLLEWPITTVLHSTLPNTPDTGFETQTYRVSPIFLQFPDFNKRVYFRLRVQRQP
jgi:hypothetical protein